jgi:integrase
MANPALRLVSPSTVNRKVAPRRPTNASLRTREHLTEGEVDRLISAARTGRYGLRDNLLILMGYRHGLRAQEIADLEWSQVEFGRNPVLHVRRAKDGTPATHPIKGDEQRLLRELRACCLSSFVTGADIAVNGGTRHGDETQIVSTSVYGKGRNNAEDLGARRISNRHRRAQHS